MKTKTPKHCIREGLFLWWQHETGQEKTINPLCVHDSVDSRASEKCLNAASSRDDAVVLCHWGKTIAEKHKGKINSPAIPSPRDEITAVSTTENYPSRLFSMLLFSNMVPKQTSPSTGNLWKANALAPPKTCWVRNPKSGTQQSVF